MPRLGERRREEVFRIREQGSLLYIFFRLSPSRPSPQAPHSHAKYRIQQKCGEWTNEPRDSWGAKQNTGACGSTNDAREKNHPSKDKSPTGMLGRARGAGHWPAPARMRLLFVRLCLPALANISACKPSSRQMRTFAEERTPEIETSRQDCTESRPT